VNVLGLMRLAQAFGPAMGARAADGDNHAVAWVNVLSIHASRRCRSRRVVGVEAAALSLAQTLRPNPRVRHPRAERLPRPDRRRMGAADPPPKLAPSAVAKAIVRALQEGVEDLYVGEVAEELRARLRENHKAVERELGG